MKRIFILLMITISLLACIGITYAATNVAPSKNSFFEEGDIVVLSSNVSGDCVTPSGSYSSFCLAIGESQNVAFYVPRESGGFFEFDTFYNYDGQNSNPDNTFVMPTINWWEFVWSTNCAVGSTCNFRGSNDLRFIAHPKLLFSLECDSDNISKDDLVSCQVKVDGYKNSSIGSLRFEIDNSGLNIYDVNVVKDGLNYDDATKMVVQNSSDLVFFDEVIMTFNIKIDNDIVNQNRNNLTRSIGITNLSYFDKLFAVNEFPISEEDELITFSINEPENFVTSPDDVVTNPDDVVTDSDDNDIVNNPKTGYLDYIVLLIGVLIISGVCLYVVKNKELVENIEK